MGIPESQWGIIWKAIDHWINKCNSSPQLLSQQLAGTRPVYMPDRIVRGIRDGSEEITSDFLHRCIRIFGLLSARQVGLEYKLTDDECIGLLTAPLIKIIDQGKFEL